MAIENMTQGFRIREYYYMMMRHKFVLLITTLAAMVIAASIAIAMPKVYRAQTVLLIETEQILNPLIAGLAITPASRERLRTLRDQLMSWPRLTLLAEKMKLDVNANNPIAYEKLIKNLRDKISINLRGGDLVLLTFEGQIPKKVQEVVQTLSDIVVEGSITSTNMETNSAIQFIENQLEEYRAKLEASETTLREFREIYNYTLPVATGMNQQLVDLKIQLNNLLVDNTEKHPRVIETRSLIKRLELRRNEQMDQMRDLGVEITPEDYARLISSVPLQEQQLAKLHRDYSVNAGIYQRLLERLETAKLSQTLEDADKGMRFKVLEPARLPLEPYKPNKPLIVIMGLVLGFGLGAGLVFLIEMSNNSIRTVEEARQLLELPIFGAIATIKPEELLLGERMRAELSV